MDQRNNTDMFDLLEKIANDVAGIQVEDADEPMVVDTMPKVDPSEVEVIQAENGLAHPTEGYVDENGDEAPEQADALLPGSPDDEGQPVQVDLQGALDDAHSQLSDAQEQLASAKEAYELFEKEAGSFIKENIIGMSALAHLIDLSTNEGHEAGYQKLAQERLVEAFKDENTLNAIIEKTAGELFESEENRHAVYSNEGLSYTIEHLASFAEDDVLEKNAFELGGIINAAKEGANNYVNAAKNFFKLKDDLASAQAHVEQTAREVAEKGDALNAAKDVGDDDLINRLSQEHINAAKANMAAHDHLDEAKDLHNKTWQLRGAAGAGLAGGSLFAGKKIYDATHSEQPDNQLSEKMANARINEEMTNLKGGNTEMSKELVRNYMKIAGAAGLIDLANDESQEESLRKEAAEAFNSISRLGRLDMEEAFIKSAQQIFKEDQLHEIVSGVHNEELFGKIASFTDMNDMSADDLEKIAGAESVAAKGVGGALTDAKKEIQATIKQDKEKTESVNDGKLGAKPAGDMQGYNVINNPGQYSVEKSAAEFEEAYMAKQAADANFTKAAEIFFLSARNSN